MNGVLILKADTGSTPVSSILPEGVVLSSRATLLTQVMFEKLCSIIKYLSKKEIWDQASFF